MNQKVFLQQNVDSELFESILAWFNAWRLLILLGSIVLLIALNRGIVLLYGMVALIWAFALVMWLVSKRNLRRVEAKASFPQHLHVDDETAVTFTLRKHGWLSAYLIELHADFPFSLEPQYLGIVRKLRGTATLKLPLRCDLRGVYRIEGFGLRSGFPVGAFVQERSYRSDAQITVYPKLFAVRSFAPLGSGRKMNGGALMSPRRGGTEYAGVREYRRGDPRRAIHWKASARRRELVVREYEPPIDKMLTIMLDCSVQNNLGTGGETTFEYAVSIAASLAIYALNNGMHLNILGDARVPMRFINVGAGSKTSLMEAFARVQADSQHSYADFIRRVDSDLHPGGVVVLFSRSDEKSPLPHPADATPFTVRFDANSFTATAPEHSKIRMKTRGCTVSKGANLEDMFA